MKKLIINLAQTGMIPTREMTPHVPIAPGEMAADALECAGLGASIIHVHARDDDGAPAYRKEIFGEIIARIRETRPDLVLSVTTSGRVHNEFERRAEVLCLAGDLKPDMASLTLGSVNFNRQASISAPDTIMKLAALMREAGIRPELEIFDLGMVNVAHYLIARDLLEPPFYFNILLGNIAAAQARLLHLGLIVSELPAGSLWSVAGIGDRQFSMNALGAVMADGVRVGIEDNIWFDASRSRLATNPELVARVAGIAGALERPIATPADVREMLSLPR